MEKYSRDQIKEIIEKENIRYIKLQFIDMLGTAKVVEVPAMKIDAILDNQIMFDGSSIEGFVRIKEADMYLHPDIDTFLILSFEEDKWGKAARFICDVYTPDGKPFSGDPRYILKKQIAKAKELGFETINVGFEPEFYLFKLDENGHIDLRYADKASYFDNSPSDHAQYVRRDICEELSKLGYLVQANHHEVGPGQNEICARYDEVLKACDYVQTFKQVVKVVARRHGYLASFMPKPVTGQAGNGMHTNVSIFKDGQNMFYDEKDPMQLSLLARKWISGLLIHCREFALLTNPSVNSYKRLVSGYEAPIYACWSDANRSSLIRIPAARKTATRTEVRNVDPTANPYLALAGIIASGLDGIVNCKEDSLIPPVSDNLFELSNSEILSRGIQRLPETLHSAVKEFEKSSLAREVVGDHTYFKLIDAKRKDWKSYHTTVSEWEINKYLDI